MTLKDEQLTERFVQGYENLLQRGEEILEATTEVTKEELNHALNTAKDRAIELEELTEEEANKIHEFVSRDLYDAGQHLLQEEREIEDWLHLNILLVEKNLLNRFSNLSLAAKLELEHLKKAKQRLTEWHTGEITSIGTLRCRACGEQIKFEHTGRIPPCPKCHAAVFERIN